MTDGLCQFISVLLLTCVATATVWRILANLALKNPCQWRGHQMRALIKPSADDKKPANHTRFCDRDFLSVGPMLYPSGGLNDGCKGRWAEAPAYKWAQQSPSYPFFMLVLYFHLRPGPQSTHARHLVTIFGSLEFKSISAPSLLTSPVTGHTCTLHWPCIVSTLSAVAAVVALRFEFF
ncbi:hypothetical protein Btru_015021 [Bulinus truncatus]|nr:hypothetical protein Btru_015021 [Bulinus truncatus]